MPFIQPGIAALSSYCSLFCIFYFLFLFSLPPRLSDFYSRCSLVLYTFALVLVLETFTLDAALYCRPLLYVLPCNATFTLVAALYCRHLLSLQPCTADFYSHYSLVLQTFTPVAALYCRSLLSLQPCIADIYSGCRRLVSLQCCTA